MVLQSSIMGLTAIIALRTYLQSRKVENARALQEIRKTLASKENKNIHQHIDEMKKKKEEHQFSQEFIAYWDKNKLDIYDYLGTLELLNIYVKTGVIDKEDFKHQYGYRLRNIIKYDELLKKIEYQNQTYPGWKDLIELLELADESKYKYPKFKL